MCHLAMICFWYLIAPWKASGFFRRIWNATYSFMSLATSLRIEISCGTEWVGTSTIKAWVEEVLSWWKILWVLKTIWWNFGTLTCGLLGFAEAITNRCGNFLGCLVLWIVTGNKNPICWMSYSCSSHCNLDHNQQYRFGKTGSSLSMVSSYKAYLYYRFT